MPKSADLPLTQPLVFEPIFMERVWGGRRLESLYGKRLPPGARIGESWEMVDRPEAQSVVCEGPAKGCTLHDLWTRNRPEIFGNLQETSRFPLLIKLLDAREKLSLQVHPPPEVAAALGGEPKTEFWYITSADPAAELYVGLGKQASRATFERALEEGTVAEQLHCIPVRTGDAMFLPAGRLHAIGGGNVLIEIQQNSDTTYRVFDWDRRDLGGKRRALHIGESLRSIDFADYEPALIKPAGQSLLRHSLFQVQKWVLTEAQPVCEAGQFAIVGCLSGAIECSGLIIRPGEFFLVPASLQDRMLQPIGRESALLRITLPQGA